MGKPRRRKRKRAGSSHTSAHKNKYDPRTISEVMAANHAHAMQQHRNYYTNKKK